jgi:hypothetical protein
MKVKFLIPLFFLPFFTLGLFFISPKKQMKFETSLYNKEFESNLKKAKYKDSYKEMDWIFATNHLTNDILSGLNFLNAILSGDYLDYLDLFIDQSEHQKLGFEEFILMHNKINKIMGESVFDKKQFKDILFYGLILGEIENTIEFKNRAWVYGSKTLSKIILSHSSILPTLDRFTPQQIEFLSVIVEGFKFENILDKYRNGICYEVEEASCFFKENSQCFNLSFLLFICKIASKYKDKSSPSFSSGLHFLLFDFKKDLIAHLRQSF